MPEWFAYLTGDLLLYVAVAPLAAAVVMIASGAVEAGARARRLFAAVGASHLPGDACQRLARERLRSTSTGVENLNERYVFYVVPLHVRRARALDRASGSRGRGRSCGSSSVVCCILAASVPFARLEYNASFQSIALMPWIGLKSLGPLLPVLVAAFTLGCGLLWLRSRREGVGRLWFVTGLTMTSSRCSRSAGMPRLPRHYRGDLPGRLRDVDRRRSASRDEGARASGASGSRPAAGSTRSLRGSWLPSSSTPRVGDVYRLGRPDVLRELPPDEADRGGGPTGR